MQQNWNKHECEYYSREIIESASFTSVSKWYISNLPDYYKQRIVYRAKSEQCRVYAVENIAIEYAKMVAVDVEQPVPVRAAAIKRLDDIFDFELILSILRRTRDSIIENACFEVVSFGRNIYAIICDEEIRASVKQKFIRGLSGKAQILIDIAKNEVVDIDLRKRAVDMLRYDTIKRDIATAVKSIPLIVYIIETTSFCESFLNKVAFIHPMIESKVMSIYSQRKQKRKNGSN